MLGKILVVIVLLFVVGVAGFFLYENLPGELRNLRIISEPVSDEPIVYGNAPMFMKNLRFDHSRISYYISDSCLGDKKDRMLEAISIIDNETVISFYEEFGGDVFVSCSEEEVELDDNLFIAGEGGPSEIVNTSLFSVILKGKVLLYKELNCDYPVVEMHELLHVFGFDHVSNEDSIMYNFSDCDQRLNTGIIDSLNEIYSIEEKADLYFDEIIASKSGRYLNFNVTIRNQGLRDAEGVVLVVYGDGKEVKRFDLKDAEVGAGSILQIKNLKLGSRGTENVKFEIVGGEELDLSNNVVELGVN